jgi:hypothetical protein
MIGVDVGIDVDVDVDVDVVVGDGDGDIVVALLSRNCTPASGREEELHAILQAHALLDALRCGGICRLQRLLRDESLEGLHCQGREELGLERFTRVCAGVCGIEATGVVSVRRNIKERGEMEIGEGSEIRAWRLHS